MKAHATVTMTVDQWESAFYAVANARNAMLTHRNTAIEAAIATAEDADADDRMLRALMKISLADIKRHTEEVDRLETVLRYIQSAIDTAE